MIILQKHKQLQFFKEKEVTKLPLRLSNLQFFSDPTPPADDTPPDDQTPPVDDTKEPQLDEATKAFIEKMVQSAEDKVRTKYTKELNATKKEL
ncbi:ribonuclease, partial [Klebsiella pneumoniae]|nr:ribonuclease [Klebsiella pneumoniae]